MTYLGVGLNSRYNFPLKSLPWHQNGGHFENFGIFQIGSFWHQIWKDRPQFTKESTFDVNDVTDDVIVWRQNLRDTRDGHRFSLLVKKPVHAILLIFKPVKHQYNLQHFSYHYHHYNQHCINKFWQVRNLRLPFHYLPKFTCQNYHFGKYVGWSCLLLAKIYILASMFVGRVCYLSVCLFYFTCQNLHFGKYVRWSCLLLAKITILASMLVGHVCPFVCLSVCTELSQNLKNDSVNHHQTWSQASTSPWFLQVRCTRM